MLLHILDSQVYFVPSLHRLTSSFKLPGYIAGVICTANWVIFERDLDESIALPQAKSAPIFDLLEPDEFARLQALWCQHLGLPEPEWSRISAGDAAALLEHTVFTQVLLAEGRWGLDATLWTAVEHSRRRYVESAAEIAALASLYPEEEQIQDLRYVMDIRKLADDFAAEFTAWSAGDALALGALTDCVYRRTPIRASNLLSQRNKTMVREVLTALDSDCVSVFVLGAAHVLGDHGLLNQLRATGRTFSIEPRR